MSTFVRQIAFTDCSSLPFIDDNDCGLGIAVRTYLDDLPLQPKPTSEEARDEVKSKGKEWFQHSDSFNGNLERAFKLWDAVGTLFSCLNVANLCRYTKVPRMRARSSRMESLGLRPINGCRRGDDSGICHESQPYSRNLLSAGVVTVYLIPPCCISRS